MSRDNHGAGPCVHCGGSGKCWDARIGDVECHECHGCGQFDDNGEPVTLTDDERMTAYCWDCASNVERACGRDCLLSDPDSLTVAQPTQAHSVHGSPSSYRARPSDPDLNPVSVKDLSASASPATKEQQ